MVCVGLPVRRFPIHIVRCSYNLHTFICPINTTVLPINSRLSVISHFRRHFVCSERRVGWKRNTLAPAAQFMAVEVICEEVMPFVGATPLCLHTPRHPREP